MNITVEKLREKHGANAEAAFKEICSLGKFGDVPPEYSGGLDVGGVLSKDNHVISDADKKRIGDIVKDLGGKA